MKDWVFFYFTLHSPPSKTYCEAHSGRFSGLRIVLLPAPSHSALNAEQWIWQVSYPITAAWPSPTLTGFPLASSHLNTDQFLLSHTTISK